MAHSKKQDTASPHKTSTASSKKKMSTDARRQYFRLSGIESAEAMRGEAGMPTFTRVKMNLKAAFRPTATRDVGTLRTVVVGEGDLIEIVFEEGKRIWVNGNQYRELVGTGATRDRLGDDTLMVPSHVQFSDARTRGILSWAVSALNVFDVDLAKQTVLKIAKSVEEKYSDKKPWLGLGRCRMNTGDFVIEKASKEGPKERGPYLLFIHGTLSSTWGSFGELWSEERRAELDALRSFYGTRVLSYDHRTLTVSPIENAIELVHALNRVLPQGAELHIVTHSRGGLIGELLVWSGKESLPATPLSSNKTTDRRLRKSFAALRGALAKKRFTVTRFVRVACPALGTTLASGRLDRWFSVLGGILASASTAPLADMFSDVGEFIAAVIKKRTEADTLPGIEAMMPESGFIAAINNPALKLSGELTVIAGDIEPDAWWAKALTWVTDKFYDSDHDLVVNTPSMYGGGARTSLALLSYHQGAEVNHFSYFKNGESAKKIVRALTQSDADSTGFQLLPKPAEPIAREVALSHGESKGREVRTIAKRQKPAAPPVRVWVAHGNLAFATHPVVVGHYSGDTIVSAEKYIDNELGGALTRRSKMGLYPGAIETSAVFITTPDNAPYEKTLKGAVVAGLGKVGALTKSALSRTVAHAMLDYVLKCQEASKTNGEKIREYGMTCLLIGTGAGGVTVSDSIFAILEGVLLANTKLETTDRPARIHEVEFIELWEDVAHLAAKTLQKLRDEKRFAGECELESKLRTCSGGRYRVSAVEDPQWWHRLQILGGGSQGKSDGILRFASLTKRARNEVRLLAPERTLVDNFIEKAVGTTRDNRAIAHTLFELLLPNPIKDQAPDRDNLVLMVDEEAARYPWELLDDPKNASGPPLATTRGLLRQLESQTFRETVYEVVEPNALVIGNPLTSNAPSLPAAELEAQEVAAVLRKKKMFDVTSSVRSSAQDVLSVLFERPYKVLHLAGHGTYEKRDTDAPPMAGMLLSSGLVLSPKTVSQMRNVPELVFINCCHLGYIEKRGEGTLVQFAANVATEFIRMGVKAVVAAGWAVDDAAAATFARTFYDGMLNGVSFGVAVLEARAKTFGAHPGSNTWGAYQCYGDPDYRMREHAVQRGEWRPSYVAEAEVIADLDNIAGDLSTRSHKSIEWQLKQLATIEMVLRMNHPEWKSNGCILAALGRAYLQAARFATAASYFAQAAAQEDGAMSVRDIERWANAQVRSAFDTAIAKGNRQRAFTLIDEAIARLERLQPLSAHTYAIIASAFKRKAMLGGNDRSRALNAMRDNYERAYRIAKEKRAETAYPLLNLAFAEIAIALHNNASLNSRSEYFKLMKEARPTIVALQQAQRDFWSAIDLLLLEFLSHIADATLTAETVDRLAERVREVRKKASPKEFHSVLDQLEFLEAMTGKRRDIANLIRVFKNKCSEDPVGT